MALTYVPPARTVQTGKLIVEPVNLFLGDGVTRSTGVGIAGLTLRVDFNGAQVAWPLVSGTGVVDVLVSAGKVYWTEVNSGFYTLRFFPNAVGLWRLILDYPAFTQTLSFTFDVGAPVAAPGIGIRASFTKK